MMTQTLHRQSRVAPPANQHTQMRLDLARHIDALNMVTNLHLLTMCRLAVRLPHRRCHPLMSADLVGAPGTNSEVCER